MIIGIKLMKINVATGKFYFPVCNVKTMFSVDLDEYITTYKGKMKATDDARHVAATEVLQEINKAFKCPLAWQAFDTDDLSLQSKQQLYFPERNSVVVDLTMNKVSHPAVDAKNN